METNEALREFARRFNKSGDMRTQGKASPHVHNGSVRLSKAPSSAIEDDDYEALEWTRPWGEEVLRDIEHAITGMRVKENYIAIWLDPVHGEPYGWDVGDDPEVYGEVTLPPENTPAVAALVEDFTLEVSAVNDNGSITYKLKA